MALKRPMQARLQQEDGSRLSARSRLVARANLLIPTVLAMNSLCQVMKDLVRSKRKHGHAVARAGSSSANTGPAPAIEGLGAVHQATS